MVSSSTEICNLAIGHCGVSKIIAALDTERSIEAQSCRTFYATALDDTLREIPWLFAKKFVTLGLVGNQPTPEWLFSYRLPGDCVHFIRIVSLRLNNDTRQSRVEYTLTSDTVGGLVYTNWPGLNSTMPVTAEYTYRNQLVAQYPSDFVLALSLKLAYYIVKPITSGDPFNKRPALMQEFSQAIMKAGNTNVNEEQRPEEPQSEFIRFRNNNADGLIGQRWQPLVNSFDVK